MAGSMLDLEKLRKRSATCFTLLGSHTHTLDAISGPSGRTNFLRASLLFPKATLPQKRQLQKEVLDKLKT